MSNMQISDKGINLLMQREGCILHVYKDVKGLPTIGVGHLIQQGESFTTLTQQQAEDLFKADLQEFVDALNDDITVTVTQDQFDALVSLCFNIGIHAFDNSTVLRKLNAGDILGAANAFNMWNKPAAIIGRRYNEFKQFKGLI